MIFLSGEMPESLFRESRTFPPIPVRPEPPDHSAGREGSDPCFLSIDFRVFPSAYGFSAGKYDFCAWIRLP